VSFVTFAANSDARARSDVGMDDENILLYKTIEHRARVEPRDAGSEDVLIR